jgi:hypothetical protein
MTPPGARGESGAGDQEWQLVGKDDWMFGRKVRGLVRRPMALAWRDESRHDPRGNWIWCAFPRGDPVGTGGFATSLAAAVTAAEGALALET